MARVLGIHAHIMSTEHKRPLPHFDMCGDQGNRATRFVAAPDNTQFYITLHVPDHFDWRGNNALQIELSLNTVWPLTILTIPKRPDGGAITLNITKWPIWGIQDEPYEEGWCDTSFIFKYTGPDEFYKRRKPTVDDEPLGSIQIAIRKMRILEYKTSEDLLEGHKPAIWRSRRDIQCDRLWRDIDTVIEPILHPFPHTFLGRLPKRFHYSAGASGSRNNLRFHFRSPAWIGQKLRQVSVNGIPVPMHPQPTICGYPVPQSPDSAPASTESSITPAPGDVAGNVTAYADGNDTSDSAGNTADSVAPDTVANPAGEAAATPAPAIPPLKSKRAGPYRKRNKFDDVINVELVPLMERHPQKAATKDMGAFEIARPRAGIQSCTPAHVTERKLLWQSQKALDESAGITCCFPETWQNGVPFEDYFAQATMIDPLSLLTAKERAAIEGIPPANPAGPREGGDKLPIDADLFVKPIQKRVNRLVEDEDDAHYSESYRESKRRFAIVTHQIKIAQLQQEQMKLEQVMEEERTLVRRARTVIKTEPAYDDEDDGEWEPEMLPEEDEVVRSIEEDE